MNLLLHIYIFFGTNGWSLVQYSTAAVFRKFETLALTSRTWANSRRIPGAAPQTCLLGVRDGFLFDFIGAASVSIVCRESGIQILKRSRPCKQGGVRLSVGRSRLLLRMEVSSDKMMIKHGYDLERNWWISELAGKRMGEWLNRCVFVFISVSA